MARRYEAYRVRTRDNLGDPEFWNARLEDIDLRIAQSEDGVEAINEAAERVEALALDRVNQAIVPLVAQAQEELSSIPELFRALSPTSLTVGFGEKTLFVQPSERLLFIPSRYLSIQRVADPDTVMSGILVGYDRETGELTLDITELSGSGTWSDWEITIGGQRGPQGLQGEPGVNGAPPLSIATDVTITASSDGQTSFTIPGGYSTLLVLVAKDGVLLEKTAYTASNGTTVVLGSGSGVTSGTTKIRVISFSAFSVAGAAQRSLNLSDLANADTALGNLGGTTVGKAVLKATDQAAARTAIGSPAVSHSHIIGDTTGLQAALDAKVPTSRQVSAGGLATGGGALSADRTISVPAASQAEAEGLTDNTKAMTALRTYQAVKVAMGWSLIGTSTVSSPVSSVIFKDFGDEFRELLIWLSGVSHNNGSAAIIRVCPSINNGVSFPTSYYEFEGDSLADINPTEAFTASYNCSGEFIIFNNPFVSNLYTAWTSKSDDFKRYVGSGIIAMGGGAVNAIRVNPSAGSLDAGAISLYGRL